ncbi:MAG: PHP domain-containing protein, partial [Brevibacterium aurantiacum]|nr:PHP domain-containing protein [Brevibacterium aurantiacum]
MVIDLHVHTAFSDGTQTPSELLSEASMEGIDVLGVTDHDTTAGWAPAEAAARVYGLGLVRGMEISCRHEGISVHLLSYLHDPYDTGLAAVVEETRRARLDRTHLIIDRLAEDYPVDMDAVLAVSGEDATIGRPHIADALVAAGIVESRTEAFGSILSSHGKYHVSLPTIDPITAIALIREAGGVSVFAHPRAAMRGLVVPDTAMADFIAAGLDGLEVDHRDNPQSEREIMRRLAHDHDLIITGSSDY